MVHLDSRGLPLSTASGEAAALYRNGVDLMLSAWPGAAASLDEAILRDPGFALAHAARARLHASRAEVAEARSTIAAARTLVAARGTDRERSHVETLALAIEGRSGQALERALAHVESWPRDALILSLPLGAFGLFAFSGMADHDQARVDLCERHAGHYGGDDWWFLTYRGWARVENRDVRGGLALAERAFGLRRANANAVHALSHALFESGAGREADALIAGWLPGYDRSGALFSHIAWHQALAALEAGDAERALAIYTETLQPSSNAAAPLNVVSDGASLLWRLKAYGHEVPGALWEDVAAYASRTFPAAAPAFMDVHIAILDAATGNRAGIERRAASLAEGERSGGSPAGPAAAAIGRALLAFADGDYADCARRLDDVATDLARIGGSRAQREVIEDTQLVALMRSGGTTRARALLDRRLHRRPSPRDARWRETVAD